ncbi:MAG: arsenic efflux protein [Olsenella sp.]|nr:arsenic efflux protein [Olsenella sp.]
MEVIIDALIDSLKDTLELVPFLFLTYLAMEALEHGMAGRTEDIIRKADKSGPIVGALLGALPQCGFSAMAGTLYAGGVVTVGTLVAVILSTSDEMIPVFIAHQEPVSRLLSIVGVKVVVGMAVGLVLDAVLRLTHRSGDGHAHIHELCDRAHCHCDDELGESDAAHDAAASSDGVAGHHHPHAYHAAWGIVRSAAIHTVEVTFFIFLVTIAFGLVFSLVGQNAIGEFLGVHPVRATFLAALIGLIPNCGASVVIAELYLDGSLAAGPMLAGLLVSGGMGLLVLFRTNPNMRKNVTVTLFVYAVGVAVGLLANALGIVF